MGNCGKINGIMMVYLPSIFTYIWVMLRQMLATIPYMEHYSMDWFKGKLKPESPMIFMGKSMVSG